jgi:hypothetical protein
VVSDVWVRASGCPRVFCVCVGGKSKSAVGRRCGMWVAECMCLCADCASNDFVSCGNASAGVGVCQQQRKVQEDQETGHTPSRPGWRLQTLLR